MPFLKKLDRVSRSRNLENLSKRHGLRHAIFNVVGDKYIGEWKEDFKSGKGSLLTRFKQLYEGDFAKNYRHGFGVLSYENPCKVFILEYRGGWRRGKMHGFGMRKYRDGGVYIGMWRHGKREGYGHMWYPNGDFYSGNFLKDMREGLGMLVYPNLNRYEGNWHLDMKHGKGKFLHLDSGQLQRGVWFKDICIYSVLFDIKYRQTSIYPTKYPIPKIELIYWQKICTEREIKALLEEISSCVSLNLSLAIFEETTQDFRKKSQNDDVPAA